MSTLPLIDPQSQAHLFRTPAEIRHAIYAHLSLPTHLHISLLNGRLRRSTCIARIADDHQGYGRKPIDGSFSDRVWARRLQSTWCLHWECKEVVLRNDHKRKSERDAHASLGLVCKRMYLDIVAFLASGTTFHIADVETVSCLTEPRYQGPSAFVLAFSVVPRITRLSVCLRLPLAFLRALEAETGTGSSTDSPEVVAWQSLSDGVVKLRKLRRLRIWLDHDGQESWTVVNERAVISHLLPLSHLPNLLITLDLPKLHPKFETPERHFTTDRNSSPFPIHRRLRQRYYCVEKIRGVGVVEKSDFPILIPDVHEFVWPEKTMEEMEEFERDMWKNGKDVEGVIRECISDTVLCYGG